MAHIHSNELAGSRLRLGLFFSSAILVVELFGAYLSNSLALLSDAGHVSADIIALALSWYGVRQASRPAGPRMTFGYHRVGVIIAIVNALAIFAISIFIFIEVFHRLQAPPQIDSIIMLIIAVAGLATNTSVALLLRREQAHSINVRSAFWHVLGDALASIGVIISAIVIIVTGNYVADAVVSLFIGLIIAASGVGILREGLSVLLEAAPRGIDVPVLIERLRAVPGVKDIHDVHVWGITPELAAMNGHILIDDLALSDAGELRAELERVISRDFNIKHTTLQMECERCNSQELFCSLEGICLPEEKKK